ncbi:uncharacterized protein FA14DRAFT_162500 [Meira miltonrushii]|uniref:Uncharacterized protein n=1 Tax=Meira miltonrushii TaxID=1280837 RepID=A0A316V4F8_9BASI|nr:uncharacterized protein FA14DRAFT_162500 [Meira miltonrushii]PWN32342.1 hypothetical protein FA14DRAFT_162500 [Meira miltonrushii]
MFRATVVRRFEAVAPRFQPQSKAVQQAMRPTNSAQSSESSTSVTHNGGAINNPTSKGRVAMMPGTTANIERTQKQKTQQTNVNNNEFESILTVGTVSGQGEGQKIFQTAQAEI